MADAPKDAASYSSLSLPRTNVVNVRLPPRGQAPTQRLVELSPEFGVTGLGGGGQRSHHHRRTWGQLLESITNHMPQLPGDAFADYGDAHGLGDHEPHANRGDGFDLRLR
jgi:hypothetical protein